MKQSKNWKYWTHWIALVSSTTVWCLPYILFSKIDKNLFMENLYAKKYFTIEPKLPCIYRLFQVNLSEKGWKHVKCGGIRNDEEETNAKIQRKVTRQQAEALPAQHQGAHSGDMLLFLGAHASPLYLSHRVFRVRILKQSISWFGAVFFCMCLLSLTLLGASFLFSLFCPPCVHTEFNFAKKIL